MNPPLRVELDSNAFDEFLLDDRREDDVLIARVNSYVRAAKLVLLTTHVQEDELAATPNAVRRETLLRVFRKLDQQRIATSAMSWDHSKWGEAKWGSGGGQIRVEHIQKGHPRQSKDALIGTSASADADVLVTNEKRTLPNRIAARGTMLKVWTFEKFVTEVAKL
jgi:hypothetical protein